MSREVRVFISSTFRDMQKERDYLVKFTFPELRKRCRQRGVELTEVDLRWGITEEQAERGEVLPLCLSEIDNCRPYFVGILGERYGWVPEVESIPQELLRVQPWLEEHQKCSVTELEILHGVLNSPEMLEKSYFYFRDPGYLQEVHPDQRSDFESENSESAEKLRKLKDKIKRSKCHLKENYKDPVGLGDMILEDLWTAIDHDFPEGSKPDLHEQLNLEHESYALSKVPSYVKRSNLFDQLNNHIATSYAPRVVLGESGSGKSSFLANWAMQYRDAHPDTHVFMHFVGCSPDSTDYVSLIARLMRELRRLYDIKEEVPQTPEKLRDDLPNWLLHVSADKPLILILDGVNQLEDRDNAADLVWLPSYFPPHVHLIISTLPGRSLDALTRRDWPSIQVELFTENEKIRFIEEYLAIYRKSLSGEQIRRIALASQTENPLFLKAVLQELRLFGEHEELDKRIEYYLDAKNPVELYSLILDRWEDDYDKEESGLFVAEAMLFIMASRWGRSESELLDLIGEGSEPFPVAKWAPFRNASEESLVIRAGLINFAHDYLRQAVKLRYLNDDFEEKEIHGFLANYLLKTFERNDNRILEVPWQHAKAEQWDDLHDFIRDLEYFFPLNTNENKYELLYYWRMLEPKYDPGKSYLQQLKIFKKETSELYFAAGSELVAHFLKLVTSYDICLKLYRDSLKINKRILGAEHSKTLSSMGYLADLFKDLGDYDKAEKLFRRILAINNKIYGPEDVKTAKSLDDLSILLKIHGKLDKAEELARRSLAISEKIEGSNHSNIATSLNNLATILSERGEYEEAKKLCRRACAIKEKVYGPAHPETGLSLHNLSIILTDLKEYDEAEKLCHKSLNIKEKIFGALHPEMVNSLNQLAILLTKKNKHDEAEILYRKILEIHKKPFGPEHPDMAFFLHNLASTLEELKEYDKAESLYKKSLAISEKTFGFKHLKTAFFLTNLASFFQNRGDNDAAEPLYRRALEIREKVLGPDHPDTVFSLNILAVVLQNRGDYDAAEPLHRRALEIREKVLSPDHPDTALSLNNLAVLLKDREDYDAAEPLYLRTLEIRESVFGPDHPDTISSLNNLAVLLKAQEKYDEAEPLFIKELAIRKKLTGEDHPSVAKVLENLMFTTFNLGEKDKAKNYGREALKIREKILDPMDTDLAQSFYNLAYILKDKEEYDGSIELFRKALFIQQKILGLQHPKTKETAHEILALLQILLQANEKSDLADNIYQEGIQLCENIYGPEHLETIEICEHYGKFLTSKKDFDAALKQYNSALIHYEKFLSENYIKCAEILSLTGETFRLKGELNEAESAYKRALNIRLDFQGEDHVDTAESYGNLGYILAKKKEYNKARKYLIKACSISDSHQDNHKMVYWLYYLLLISEKEEEPKKSVEICEKIIPLIETYYNALKSDSNITYILAHSYDTLALLKEVPEKKYDLAEHHYWQAIKLFNEISSAVEAANAELNLFQQHNLSGKKVDIERVKELTKILSVNNDERAEKGEKLLDQLNCVKTDLS